MTDTSSNQASRDMLFAALTRVRQIQDQWSAARARRRKYQKATAELTALSNRELEDLGIPRSHIKRIAWEAAYAD